MGMLHSQWTCYIHNGHVTFTMGTLHSQWARYIPNGLVTFQVGTLHSKWARYIPNGHVTFQMGTLHSKWACYIPNGHVTFQMGMSHSKWACFMVRPLESLVEIRLDTQSMGSVSLAITLIASILFSSSCIASYLRHGCTTGATEGWMALWCHPLLLYATIAHAVYRQITHVRHPSV